MKIKVYWNTMLTEKIYKLVRTIGKPFAMAKFKPIILNVENIPKEGPIVFAPNHRQTVDPFFIISAADVPIHWAALKRFFTAEDSIFNNSKNPILCKFTSVLFRGIGAVPIDREKPNISSIKKLNMYLKNGRSIGIFPEGTTNKNPQEQDLLPIKPELLHLAKRNNAWVQPISIVWVPKDTNIKNRVLINFMPPYKIDDMSIDESLGRLISAMQSGIDENKKLISGLQDVEDVIIKQNKK